MQNKEWLLIILSVILLASLVVFLIYQNTVERYSKIEYDKGYEFGYDNGYEDKICKDNYKEDYADGFEEGEQKVLTCVNNCHYQYPLKGSRQTICLRVCGIKSPFYLNLDLSSIEVIN